MTIVRYLLSLFFLFSLFSPAAAFSFSFSSQPTQCGNITVEWDGGTAPFTLLVVPVGHVTPEIRTIIQENVSSGSSVTFQLNYPSGSQFIAILNDATGIGSGGTSVITTVGDSDDSSCLRTSAVSPEFFLFLPNSVSQCASVDISWSSGAQPPIDILGLIPGGQSFEITSVTDSSTSFNWKANVRSGTDVVFVAGDKTGLGSGGSSDIMSIGSSSDDSCISSNAPSSTASPAAGGVSSTSSNGGSTSSSSRTQTGSVVTTTDNSGSTVTVDSPPTLTTTDSSGSTTVVTEGQGPTTSTDSSGHTTTMPGSPVTTTDNSGHTVTIGGSSFPGSGGGTVTGSSSNSSNGSSKNLLPLILGLIFGLLALLGLLIGAYILYRRRSAHAYRNLETGKGPQDDAQPWFARGTHLRGGANSSQSTLPSMYQTEPFIMPSEPQGYYNFSPTPSPMQAQQHREAEGERGFQRPAFSTRGSSSRSIHSLLDNVPLTPSAFGYGLLGMHGPSHSHSDSNTNTQLNSNPSSNQSHGHGQGFTQTHTPHSSSDSKTSSFMSPGPHGRPPSRTPSGRAISQLQTNRTPYPVTNPDPPTRVARDSEDLSPGPEETSPNPFEDPVVDIPPTYASVRRASIRRSLEDGGSRSPGGRAGVGGWPVRPGGGLHRSNARRSSYRSDHEARQQGSQS